MPLEPSLAPASSPLSEEVPEKKPLAASRYRAGRPREQTDQPERNTSDVTAAPTDECFVCLENSEMPFCLLL